MTEKTDSKRSRTQVDLPADNCKILIARMRSEFKREIRELKAA